MMEELRPTLLTTQQHPSLLSTTSMFKVEQSALNLFKREDKRAEDSQYKSRKQQRLELEQNGGSSYRGNQNNPKDVNLTQRGKDMKNSSRGLNHIGYQSARNFAPSQRASSNAFNHNDIEADLYHRS